MSKKTVSIFWFRRDLRLKDNAGLYHALKGDSPVLPLFIFDKDILDKLEDRDDARVTFIYQQIEKLKQELEELGSSLLIRYGKPLKIWEELLEEYDVKAAYTNRDYEPYAKERDEAISKLLGKHDIPFSLYKDQVIFEREEVVKENKEPYTVFTPYKNSWLKKLNAFFIKPYPTRKYFKNFYQTKHLGNITLKEMGFTKSEQDFPDKTYKDIIDDYARDRDFPAKKGTSRIGLHLRFGTVSIRELVSEATKHEQTWLSELIWREFYMMMLDFFPHTINKAYRPAFDQIEWRNNQQEFKAWCEGKTGYGLVDAGMRQLIATGFMHNRVRMVVASFLIKHLLIDWRWGEHYFARYLLDYEAASNVGGWQWVAGSGTDTMPYFRIFNPETQMEKFDPKLEYVKKWVPEYGSSQYPKPIVEHKEARDRCLKVFKQAVG
ncbi:DNA photolyase family protein [Mucilaginibacter sp. RS28]|uniref:DNA photolyase family protein n=1 Tax=Mucilaginibacter straminoryzae TaxID=2932774 RepID=A0A9X1X3N0_9SPHI|nr:deoxyribodipyrimidine photo-lyase [Mucilaginibacter straminoryzae]MCJ8210368.1 DNA photolyase family protein [Mucilaginibacter straminoryzae]